MGCGLLQKTPIIYGSCILSMSTQVEAVLPRKKSLEPIESYLRHLESIDANTEWKFEPEGIAGACFYNGTEIIRVMPRTFVFTSSLSWVGFLSDPEARMSFLKRLKVSSEALFAEQMIIYPNIGYTMELVADFVFEEGLGFEKIILTLRDKYRVQELLFSDLCRLTYTRDEATDIDAYLILDRKDLPDETK